VLVWLVWLVWLRHVAIDPVAICLPSVTQGFFDPVPAALIGALFPLVVRRQIRRPQLHVSIMTLWGLLNT
jgi:hypothetical protein